MFLDMIHAAAMPYVSASYQPAADVVAAGQAGAWVLMVLALGFLALAGQAWAGLRA